MDRSRYAANWREISLRIRERDGWRCKWCGASQRQPHPETGSIVVLTVAHINHDPSDDRDDNLAALCQKCHLTHDAAQHAANAARTRRAKRIAAGQGELGLELCD